MLSQHLQQSGEVLGVSRRETPCPVEHIRGVSCQGRHHERHEVRILIIIPVIGDALRPLPKGSWLHLEDVLSCLRIQGSESYLRTHPFFLRLTVEAWLSSESATTIATPISSSGTSPPRRAVLGWRCQERFLPHLRLGEKRGIPDVPEFR